MKKFLTLVLALVMVLALAAPAMAFTSDTYDDASPYELDVYLVEYDDVGFGTFTALPPSDRGYAKNEIVAVVGELFVPKGEDPYDDGYETVEFSGDNVSFNVGMDSKESTNAPALSPVGTNGADGWDYDIANNILEGKKTFKWLVFAKVTDDDASITFALKGNADELTESNPIDIDEDYSVEMVAPTSSSNGSFTVLDGTQELFIITVDKNYKTKGLKIVYDDTVDVEYTVVSLANGKLGFIAATGGELEDDKGIINDLMDIYEDVFVDVFGFDFDLIGGVVKPGYFEDLRGSADIEVTVEIEPWTAYVTVPDNIVVDPPKTGDAASILGFVMIVLAAAAVVAVRKVRA